MLVSCMYKYLSTDATNPGPCCRLGEELGMASVFKDFLSHRGDKACSQISTLEGRPSKNEADTRWKGRQV